MLKGLLALTEGARVLPVRCRLMSFRRARLLRPRQDPSNSRPPTPANLRNVFAPRLLYIVPCHESSVRGNDVPKYVISYDLMKPGQVYEHLLPAL